MGEGGHRGGLCEVVLGAGLRCGGVTGGMISAVLEPPRPMMEDAAMHGPGDRNTRSRLHAFVQVKV